MKKQKSSTIVLSEFSSSDDESEKATPKIDKEELIKFLKHSDEESSQEQITPKRPKNDKRLKTPPIEGSPIIKPKKVISKDPPQNYLVQGNDFKKLQKKAKENLEPHLLIIPKEKIINTSSNTITKRFTSDLPILKISLLTKIQFVETSISPKPRKFQTKMDNLHTKFPLIQIIGLSNF